MVPCRRALLQYCPSMPSTSQSSQLSELTAGLDIGTTSVKAVLADEDGKILARFRRPSALVVEPAGRFEHDAVQTWWDGPRLALRDLVISSAPRAVAVSGMMPSVAAVDMSGRPIGPGLLYGDGRGASDSGGADPTASHEMADLSSWAAQDAPGAAGYWPAQAVANASLGGEGITDLASAFAAGPLFDGSGWDPAVCASAGLSPGQLPRVAVFGEPIGKVDVATIGDVARSEVVLGAGSVDGLCEQLVAGALDDGDVLVGLGSTLVVWLTVPGWPDQPPGLWRVPHIVGGKAMVGGASNAGGLWADWVDRTVRPTDGDEVGAFSGPSLRPDDVPLWWPWAKGERVPFHDTSLRIGLAGADLSQGPAALRRAALEATGFVVRHIIERASACGTGAKRVVVSGGGSRHAGWLQAIADVLDEPVVPMAVPEGAALGAAFLARMALGLETSIGDAARWARWSAPVEPAGEWAVAADERYRRWLMELPSR
jgi:xylulokinase